MRHGALPRQRSYPIGLLYPAHGKWLAQVRDQHGQTTMELHKTIEEASCALSILMNEAIAKDEEQGWLPSN